MKASFPVKSQKNGVGFKPLIASSLAIALGVSVAMAQPTTQIGWDSQPESNKRLKLEWTDKDNYYQASYKEENNAATIDNLTFRVKEGTFSESVTLSGSNYEANISTDYGFSITSDKGIRVGNDGTGTLTFGAKNDRWGKGETITINLGKTMDNTTYALHGNLTIDNWQTGHTKATFGRKGIKGDVSLKSAAGTNTLTFNNNAGIEGNLILMGGKHHITFGNNSSTTPPHTSTITGNIQATGGNSTIKGLVTLGGDISSNQGANTTTILQGNSSIKGNISLNSGDSTTIHTNNRVIFNGNSATIGENSNKADVTIKFTLHSSGASWQHTGSNAIISNSSNNTFYIGSFKTDGNYGPANPEAQTLNIITLNNTLNNDSSSNTVSIDSMHSLHGNNMIGKNLITTSGSDNSTITYNATLFGSNTPTIQNNFSTNFANSSHTAKGNFTIGSISTDAGKNYINVENLTITSSVSSKGGENLVVTPNLTFGSNSKITAGNGGYGAKNVFDTGNVNFGNSLVIKADNTTNQHTEKHNIFKISGTINTGSPITELTAITGNSNHNYTMNILSFDGSANPKDSQSSLTIEDINKSSTIGDKATGHNYIGKALTQGEGLGMGLDPNFVKSWSSTNHRADLTLKVNSGIYAKYGKNHINVASLDVGKDIDANAGHNYISTNSLTSNGTIKARWGGSNTIIVDEKSTINGIEAGSGGQHNDSGVNNLTFGGDTTIQGNILINDTNRSKNNFRLSNGNTTLTLQGATNQITTLTALATIDNNSSQNNTLTLDATNNNITANINTLENGDNLKIDFKGGSDKSITLTLNSFGKTDGKTNAKLRSVSVSGGKNNTLAFNQSATIIDPISNTSVGGDKGLTLQVNSGATLHAQGGIDKGNEGNINVALDNGTLTFGTSSNHISNLSGNGVINLSSHTPNTLQATQTATNDKRLRNSLTIDNFTSGETTFKLYASSTQNDRVVFNGGNSGAKAIITLSGGNDIYDITYSSHLNANNTLVAQTNNGSGIIVEGGESLIGVDRIKVELISTSNESTTNYYVGKVIDLGVDPVFQEMSNTALMVNYDLFLANFNSLNKRMGELRENDHNHGVWTRIFGGSTSHSFGAGGKSDYVTVQAGYDYSIEAGENARNYMGIALAYGSSATKSKTINITASTSLISSIGLDNIKSNIIEVGLYNSYVADSGWYNDTILKFNYIMSEFSMSNNPSSMNKIKNFATILSDEFGYRYKFAENEKGNWYIDPQVEVAFGYFNQSDFVRTVFDHSSELYAYQDAVLTLRTRAGASLGKKFNTENGFATLYAGAFYEYDYIKGGDSKANGGGSQISAQLDKIESNGRAIVNVGSNIELTEGTRLYIDVEKSFGDKQRTHMQFNLGARYSF